MKILAFCEKYDAKCEEPEWCKGLDLVLYINLDHRVDRRNASITQFQSLGIPCGKVVRIEAIKAEKPARGCTLSHRNAVSFAMIHDCKRVMICEDDFSILSLEKFHTAMNSVISPNMLMVGMTPIKLTPFVGSVVHVQQALGLGSYIIPAEYYVKMLTIFEEALAANQPHDLITQRYQASDQWLGFYPAIARQSPGFSDIENRHTDYGFLEVDAQMLRK